MQELNKKFEICDAALGMFAHYGYKKTTMTDVASAVGMTKSNLYFYFSNKKNLYEQTVETALISWRDAVAEAISKKDDAVEKFLVLSTASFAYIARRAPLQALLIKDPNIFTLSRKEDRFYDVNRGAMVLLENILEQGIAEGAFHVVDIPHTTEFLFSVYIMFLIKTYVKSEGSSAAGIYRAGLSMILRGLCKDAGTAMMLLEKGFLAQDIFNHD